MPQSSSKNGQMLRAPVLSLYAGVLRVRSAELGEAERSEFLESMGASESGLDRLVESAYKLLGLITYFTAGVKEVRAWTRKRRR